MSRLCVRAATVSSAERWGTTSQPFSRRSRLISSIIANSNASSGLVVGAGVVVGVAVGVGVAAVVGHGVLVAISVGAVVGCALTADVVVIVGVICDGDVGLAAATG